MAIGVIATIPVQEGKNDEFEAVFLELAESGLFLFFAADHPNIDASGFEITPHLDIDHADQTKSIDRVVLPDDLADLAFEEFSDALMPEIGHANGD